MPSLIDLTGQTFGFLTVQYQSQSQRHSTGTRAVWFCLCICGNTKEILAHSLLANLSKSCGCRGKQHGASKLRLIYPGEYKIWVAMWQRCTNSHAKAFIWYGGLGVTVTPEWKSFDQFIADVGPRPSKAYSLDRFPDGHGNYEPSNVRWATRAEQARNTSRNHWYTYRGVTMCRGDWAKSLGITDQALTHRIKSNWSEDLIFAPVHFDNQMRPRASSPANSTEDAHIPEHVEQEDQE